MSKVKLIIKCLTNLSFVCYPFIIYLSLRYQEIKLAIFYLAALFILRLLTLPNILVSMRWLAKITAFIGLSLLLSSWLFSQHQILFYYPVMVNVVFLITFGYSLSQPQTIVEKFARIKDANLPTKAIKYTRKVTICWCLFFMLNGSIALITCLINNLYWWTMYNGLISYILIGTLMVGEWLIRQQIKQ
ncbi:hypothetical protein [uncultured Gilliamella sp.]|uniref:COG4648 family protein n=1 Tax=uncultured Gilliamella sp. TaxID=1193505 RepID=UPI0025E936D1|nr:hypothetical protein [uncultured Gilliamella sp.]